MKIKLHKTHVQNQLLLHVYLPSHATSTREQCLVYYSPVLFFFFCLLFHRILLTLTLYMQTSLFNQKKIIDLSTKSRYQRQYLVVTSLVVVETYGFQHI